MHRQCRDEEGNRSSQVSEESHMEEEGIAAGGKGAGRGEGLGRLHAGLSIFLFPLSPTDHRHLSLPRSTPLPKFVSVSSHRSPYPSPKKST